MFSPPPKQALPEPLLEPPKRAIQRLLALVVPVAVLILISLSSKLLLDANPSTAPRKHAHGLRAHHARHPAPQDPATPVASAQQLAASVVPAIPNPPWPVPAPFPQPFDSSLSFNFSTSTCSSFFSAFTANITFRACRPFSLLLGTSNAFFNVQSNLTALTAVMGGTCDTTRSDDDCRSTMNWLAAEIVKPDVCATEVSDQNSMVLQALSGFKTYDLMRQAGCLVNQRSNAYCFVESVASTSPVDTYFYALPLGTPVPQSSVPSCSACIKSLMALYAQYATDTSLPLSKSYPSAQKLATSSCGSDYARAVATNSAQRAFASWRLLLGLVILGISLG